MNGLDGNIHDASCSRFIDGVVRVKDSWILGVRIAVSCANPNGWAHRRKVEEWNQRVATNPEREAVRSKLRTRAPTSQLNCSEVCGYEEQ